MKRQGGERKQNKKDDSSESALTSMCLYNRCSEDLSYIRTRNYTWTYTATLDY